MGLLGRLGARVGIRSAATHGVVVQTSVGEVSGEVWSDGIIAIGTYEQDAEAEGFSSRDDLLPLLAQLGLPKAEAATVADELWNDGIAAFAHKHFD